MSLLFLDFETYYDRAYSLKKITPAEYILDPRFETICMGVAKNGEPATIIDGPDIGDFLAAQTSATTTTVTYNALFDNAILAWRFSFIPGRIVDCLGMARALLGSRLPRLGLAQVAEHLQVGKKGDAIHNVVGMHRTDIMRDADLWAQFKDYCLNDTETLRAIFTKLHPEFPKDEYAIMDAVLRCCIQPAFHCDVEMLKSHLAAVRAKKEQLCAVAGLDRDSVSGNGSFIAALEAQGVQIKTKPGKRGDIPAIAKTDAFMQELLEDSNEVVQCLAAARLGVKSTLEERRSERLISIASLPWPNGTSFLPVPLRYCGAHTWRLSGDWKVNLQNLPSARMGDPVLRRSLLAPPGHKVVVGDLAQIEARLVAWFCRSELLLTEFREKRDPYSRLAETTFGLPVDKTTMDGVARHIGKAGILGCGYGLGAQNFYRRVLEQSRAALKPQQMEQLLAIWTPELAEKSVNAYRRRYSDVRSMWKVLEDCLTGAWLGLANVASRRIGPIEISHRNGCGIVSGPGGREIRYPAPRIVDGELWWTSAGVPTKIYGAALLENIIQFLARVVIFDVAMRLKQLHGLCFVHQCHDELVFIVPESEINGITQTLQEQMRQPPAWCSDLPLDCDVGNGQNYGDCK